METVKGVGYPTFCFHSLSSPKPKGGRKVSPNIKEHYKKFCKDKLGLWEEYLPYFLFVIRSVPNNATGYSPFDILLAHTVKGPLELLRDNMEEGNKFSSVEKWINTSRGKLLEMWYLAKQNIVKYQKKMKGKYDIGTKKHSFEEGQHALVLQQPVGHKFQSKFIGPYEIVKKCNDSNYVVQLPGRKFKCHINMLKAYRKREIKPVMLTVKEDSGEESDEKENLGFEKNSEVLRNLHTKVSHWMKSSSENYVL